MRLRTSSLLALLLAASAASALAHPRPTQVARASRLSRRSRFADELQDVQGPSIGDKEEPESSLPVVSATPTARPRPSTPNSEGDIVSSLFAAYETNMPSAWISSLAADQTPAALVDVIEALPTGAARKIADEKCKELKAKAIKILQLKTVDHQVDVTDLRQAQGSGIIEVPDSSAPGRALNWMGVTLATSLVLAVSWL